MIGKQSFGYSLIAFSSAPQAIRRVRTLLDISQIWPDLCASGIFTFLYGVIPPPHE